MQGSRQSIGSIYARFLSGNMTVQQAAAAIRTLPKSKKVQARSLTRDMPPEELGRIEELIRHVARDICREYLSRSKSLDHAMAEIGQLGLLYAGKEVMWVMSADRIAGEDASEEERAGINQMFRDAVEARTRERKER